MHNNLINYYTPYMFRHYRAILSELVINILPSYTSISNFAVDNTIYYHLKCIYVGPVAQSVWRMATGWTVHGSNPGAGEIFRTRPDRPRAHPASCTMGTGSFPEVESGRGVTLTAYPY
jgi:hypothetical protein